MSKITLTNLVNLQNETTAVNAINTNSNIITLAMDNTLSRDGTLPNKMGSNLDMDSNHILNLPAPLSTTEPVRFIDLTTSQTLNQGTMALQNANAVNITGGTIGSAVTGVTQTPGDSTTKLATDAFVANAIAALPAVVIVATSQVDTRATGIITSFGGSVNTVQTTGYAAPGDGGGAIYKRVVSLVSPSHGFQSADGAFWQITEKVFRPEMFSATADTTAIQVAIDAANVLGISGEVRLTNKNYRATTQSGQIYCLHLYGTVSLVGESPGVLNGTNAGTGTIISWGNNIANTTDVISWTGNTNNQKIVGIQFMPDGFTATVGNISANPLYGNNVINVNAGASSVIGNGVISDCTIGPANGFSILFSDASADWANGTVTRNHIWGGIKALGLLDNCLFKDNSFNGINCAMDITQVVGAGNLIIEHNNGIPAGGAVFLRNGFGSKIINNYFEVAQTFTGINGYLYNINGSLGTITNCDFKNNICAQLGNFGLIGLVFFDNTTYADIDNNILLNSGSTPILGINISANNFRPYCGKSLSFSANINPTGVTRNGITVSSPLTVAPRGYDVPLTLLNSWSANGEVPAVRCERDGTCHISGAVQSGTTTAGTVIFTLPAGFLPIAPAIRILPTTSGTVTGQIATNGNFTWFGTGASATITGVACTYMTTTE